MERASKNVLTSLQNVLFARNQKKCGPLGAVAMEKKMVAWKTKEGQNNVSCFISFLVLIFLITPL